MKVQNILTLASMLAVSGTAMAQIDTLSGQLTTDDHRREEAQYYDAHTVDVESACSIRVWLDSDEFDAFLVVKTPNGVELTNDDNEGSNSFIEVLADEPGTYTIWASAYEAESTGSYKLVIDQSDEISIDRTEGRLVPRDEQLPKGEYVDVITKKIDTKEPFTVRLKSYGFDGYLVVTSPSGQTFRNDDFEGDYTVSQLNGLEPEKGEWKIQVTTLNVEEVGAYDLDIITMD